MSDGAVGPGPATVPDHADCVPVGMYRDAVTMLVDLLDAVDAAGWPDTVALDLDITLKAARRVLDRHALHVPDIVRPASRCTEPGGAS